MAMLKIGRVVRLHWTCEKYFADRQRPSLANVPDSELKLHSYGNWYTSLVHSPSQSDKKVAEIQAFWLLSLVSCRAHHAPRVFLATNPQAQKSLGFRAFQALSTMIFLPGDDHIRSNGWCQSNQDRQARVWGWRHSRRRCCHRKLKASMDILSVTSR